MKKYLNIVSSITLMMIILVSCAKSKVQQLKDNISQFNTECPVHAGIGDLQYVSYDEKANMVTFNFVIDADYDDLFDGFGINKNDALPLLTTNQMKPMVEMLVDVDAGLEFIYKSSVRDEQIKVVFTPDELKEANNSGKSNEQSYEEYVANIVAQNNQQCPVEIEEGITMTGVSDDGSSIIFQCEIDENLYDLDVIKENISELKREMLNDNLVKSGGKILSSANRSLIYRYIGSISGETLDVRLTPAELCN